MLIKLKVLGHVDAHGVVYLKCHSFLKRWNILPHGFILGLVLATKTSCEGGGSRGYGQTLVWLKMVEAMLDVAILIFAKRSMIVPIKYFHSVSLEGNSATQALRTCRSAGST